MLRAGSNDSQNRDNSNQKIYPQPMEEGPRQNESEEALIARVFNNVSSLKTAYMQLQKAHTPYDPEEIQSADKMVIEELHKLSDLKHSYRQKHPRAVSSSPQDACLYAEIQEQEKLLKTYEVMVTKFRSQIQNRDSEILQLQKQIQDSTEKKLKLEKKLKQRGSLLAKELDEPEGGKSFLSIELTPSLLSSVVDTTNKSIHEFSKTLINMMKVAGWDLDVAANSIQPGVIYAKRSHKKYAFDSHICQRMFSSFHEESFMAETAATSIACSESFFHQFLAVRVMDPLEILSQNPDSLFGMFCKRKYVLVVHEKMESSFFGNLDQRNHILSGGHPRTSFYQAFLKMAKSIWMLHRLAHSFDPKVKVFQVKPGTEFSDVYMESVVKSIIIKEGDEKPKVGLMVMPGFMVGGSVIQSQVYLSGVNCSD